MRADAGPQNGFNLGFVIAQQEVGVWPENWPVWELFCEVDGQWRVGINGPTALDYTPLFLRMDRLGLTDDAWNQLFADLRVLEAAALQQMADNRT